MKKVVAFGASSSRNSINKKLATWAASQVEGAQVTILDLNDFEMPIYSIDREIDEGIPEEAEKFKEYIRQTDGIIISFAEHNGAYTVAFKNIMDWISRIEKSTWADKPMLLMATSPGGRGGATVLDIAVKKFKFMNTNTIVGFSLPFFGTNFDGERGIINPDLSKAFKEQLVVFEEAIAVARTEVLRN